jgi:tRNA G18 (ribose-2'-O)-methylase SpoU
LRRAIRTSMGTVFRLAILESSDLRGTLNQLKGLGIRCIGAHLGTESQRIEEADFRSDCCLVFGSEGEGLRGEVLGACGERVMVPMREGVDSLNVGNAAAVFLYEARRQRRRGI